jgi:hypothetical protein
MRIAEYVLNAPLGARLFIDDQDRRDFLAIAKRHLGEATLTYCLMDSHAHLVLEGATEWILPLVGRLRAAYARRFRRRHGVALSWRGPTRVHELDDARSELASKMRYVHLNPVRAGMVEIAIEWPWSGLREYAGLSLVGVANVERGRAVAGPAVPGALDEPPAPGERMDLAIAAAAAAQVYGLDPADLAGDPRPRGSAPARRAFIRAAIEAGHTHQAVADFLGISRERVTQVAAERVPADALRALRILIQEPRLRRRLAAAIVDRG